MSHPTVIVEFFGVPRARAGRRELSVTAATVGGALTAVMATIPELAGLCSSDGRVTSQYVVSLDGQRFVTDPSELLRTGDRLLILSADAGG